MPHEIKWIVEKRVIMTTFTGVVTIPELKEFIEDVQLMIQEGTPLVYHISNSLDMERVQFSLGALQLISRGTKLVGALGWQIDINTNAVNKMFANFASQFAGIRTRTFPSLDLAIVFLRHSDPSFMDATWLVDESIMRDVGANA